MTARVIEVGGREKPEGGDMKLPTLSDPVRLAISIAIPLAAGALGSVFTARSVTTWYTTLAKPTFSPPSWVFGPVWTALYVLMGISLFLVWRKGLGYPHVKTGLGLFAVQMALNAFWSIAFFGLRSPLAGLVVIGALLLMLILTIVTFFRVALAPGLLLVPYVVWVSFASILNGGLYALNR